MLVRLVANKMLSNSIIESEELRDLFNTAVPEYAVPGLHKFLETMVPAEFNRIEIKLNDILKQANFCSITLDLWSNRQMRSYIGITCHLIDSNFKLHSFLLECGRFKGFLQQPISQAMFKKLLLNLIYKVN